MKRLSFKPVFNLVLLSAVSLSFLGCSGSLEQQAQTVRVSPVSDKYKLTEKLEGKTYILLAETSTGQEQHRYSVSDSLARVLKESGKSSNDKKNGNSFVNLSFLGFNGMSDIGEVSSEGLEVLSFTDLANKLNEKDLCQKHAEMREFYQENGMFRKSDLEFLAKEIDADYLVLPCLLDIQRWSKGRFSVGGVKFLNTHVVSGMLGMEIWDAKIGRKVFSATSDVTLASEKIKEEPISMEDAFKRAWFGIMQELPNQFPMTDNEGSGSLENDKHVDSSNLTKGGETKAG
ncbi:MAG: hypothetical protein ACYTFW_11400 [Planctomycetota bacterium]|jgi:hypothetical protein